VRRVLSEIACLRKLLPTNLLYYNVVAILPCLHRIHIALRIVQKTPMHRTSPWFPWESATHQPQVRFDLRAEREQYERLFTHPARVLQDRMVRRSQTDRTKTPGVPEWERVYQKEVRERRVLYQARVLGWGKEKQYYFAHKQG
jgi:hypothetical protein